MASPNERTRNNVRAGIFVSVAMILALAVTIVLSDAWKKLFSSRTEYTVWYSVSDGVKNLKEGADVFIGGVAFGQVVAVRPELEEGGVYERVNVDFEVDSGALLYADATILVASALLGADAWLEIPRVGTEEAGAPPADGIRGTATVPFLTSILGPDRAEKASSVVDDVKEFSEFLASVPGEYDERVVPILDNASEATGNVRDLTARVNDDDWPRWASRVDGVLDWANGTTDTLDAILEEGQGLVTDARTGVNETREIINSNAPRIDTTVENVEATSADLRAISEHFNEITVAKVDQLLETGQSALETAEAAVEGFDREFDLWAPEVRDALAAARLSAQQLKLASMEVRRSPWKLLYRPSQSEVEHELLYAAARSFALAANDLKAAGESMRRVLEEHGEEVIADQDVIDRLNAYLLDSLETYEKAQQRILDVLFVESK